MNHMWKFLAVAAVAAILVAGPAVAQEDKTVELKVGDKAPDFNLIGSDGKHYTLNQFKGEKGVVLAFFPKAFTPG